MYNLTTLEHLTAIRTIINHAGLPLWRQALDLDAEVTEFRRVLTESAKPLKDYRTVLMDPKPRNGNAEVKLRVEAIHDYVQECRLTVINEQCT